MKVLKIPILRGYFFLIWLTFMKTFAEEPLQPEFTTLQSLFKMYDFCFFWCYFMDFVYLNSGRSPEEKWEKLILGSKMWVGWS